MVDTLELLNLNSLGKLEKAIFIERVNRFLGKILINGLEKSCYIADTGRLEEILIEGREILVVKNRESLKTDYTLITAKMRDELVLINTSLHSSIAYNAIKQGVLGFTPQTIKKEVKYKNSRFDYLLDNKTFVELKGCNLIKGDTCLFPNAPTVRGTKHLKELILAKKDGYNSIILIMAVRDCKYFLPNSEMDKEFADMFYRALKNGVEFKGSVQCERW
jgi:sugar fermentation stimulation protein A